MTIANESELLAVVKAAREIQRTLDTLAPHSPSIRHVSEERAKLRDALAKLDERNPR